MSRISHKNLTTGLPVAKTLIKYNSNNLQKTMEKEPIDLEFSEQKDRPEMMKMLFTFDDQVYKKKTEKILLWLTSLKITKQADDKIFPKK